MITHSPEINISEFLKWNQHPCAYSFFWNQHLWVFQEAGMAQWWEHSPPTNRDLKQWLFTSTTGRKSVFPCWNRKPFSFCHGNVVTCHLHFAKQKSTAWRQTHLRTFRDCSYLALLTTSFLIENLMTFFMALIRPKIATLITSNMNRSTLRVEFPSLSDLQRRHP